MFNNYYNNMVSCEIEMSIIKNLENGNFEILNDHKWPNIYFNSRFRSNVLCYLKVDKNTDILEIGSNYGTIAQYFIDKVSSYDCIELNDNSRIINQLRNKNISCIDINNIVKKYDYIILFESLFLAKNKVQLLSYLKEKLKNNGHLVVVENNRNGYLYLSGKRNEHSGQIFDNGSYFTRNELLNFLKETGIGNYKFYYPYPNTTYTTEVFTDDTINKLKPVSLDNSLDDFQISTFDDKKFYMDMMANKQMQNFVNSFVIDCSKDINPGDYFKVWSNRSIYMSIITVVDYKNGKVYKYPYTDEAKDHLIRMSNRTISYGKLQELEYKWNNDCLECDILNLKSLSDIYNEADNFKKKELINEYKNILYTCADDIEDYSLDFKKAFGEDECRQKLHWMDNGNTDMSFDNIFVDKEKWILIDSEWNLQIKIPVEFVIYRSLLLLGLSTSEISSYLNIDIDTIGVFNKWEKHLCYTYQGTKELCFHRKERIIQNRISDLFKYENMSSTAKKICYITDLIIRKIR